MENNSQPVKWHESFVAAFFFLIAAVILTSPCWGFALIAWVTK